MEIEEMINNDNFSFKDLLKEKPQDLGNAVAYKYPEEIIALAKVLDGHYANERVMNGKALLNPRRLAFEHIKVICSLGSVQPTKQYILYGNYDGGEFIVNNIELKE